MMQLFYRHTQLIKHNVCIHFFLLLFLWRFQGTTKPMSKHETQRSKRISHKFSFAYLKLKHLGTLVWFNLSFAVLLCIAISNQQPIMLSYSFWMIWQLYFNWQRIWWTNVRHTSFSAQDVTHLRQKLTWRWWHLNESLGWVHPQKDHGLRG